MARYAHTQSCFEVLTFVGRAHLTSARLPYQGRRDAHVERRFVEDVHSGSRGDEVRVGHQSHPLARILREGCTLEYIELSREYA